MWLSSEHRPNPKIAGGKERKQPPRRPEGAHKRKPRRRIEGVFWMVLWARVRTASPVLVGFYVVAGNPVQMGSWGPTGNVVTVNTPSRCRARSRIKWPGLWRVQNQSLRLAGGIYFQAGHEASPETLDEWVTWWAPAFWSCPAAIMWC